MANIRETLVRIIYPEILERNKDLMIQYSYIYKGLMLQKSVNKEIKNDNIKLNATIKELQETNELLTQEKILQKSYIKLDIKERIGKADINYLLKQEFPNAQIFLSDNTYGLISKDDFINIILKDKTNTKTYVAESNDCLPHDTILLDYNGNFVNISDVKVNDTIIGQNGEPTKVLNKIYKGMLNTIKIQTRRGYIECTEDHKIFAKTETGEIIEKRAKDLKINDVLYTPAKINIRENIIDKTNNFLELMGYYIADGWLQRYNSIGIAGKEGFKKEEQKKICQKISNELNYFSSIKYTYIYINVKKDIELFKKCGHNAHVKEVPFILTDKKQIDSMLKGLQADCSHATNSSSIIYNTVSSKLILQIKRMYKILGISMSLRWVECHGSFIDSFIWRGTPYLKREWKNKVLNIEKGSMKKCYDITTENKGIYLIQSDCVVHNCDDFSFQLMGNVSNYDIPFGILWISKPYYHAINIVILKGKIKPWEVWIIEPQDDRIYKKPKDYVGDLIII